MPHEAQPISEMSLSTNQSNARDAFTLRSQPFAPEPSEHQHALATGSRALTCKAELLADGHSVKFRGASTMNHPKIPGHTHVGFPCPVLRAGRCQAQKGLLPASEKTGEFSSGHSFHLPPLNLAPSGRTPSGQEPHLGGGQCKGPPVVGGDCVFPTHQLSQERLPRCLTLLCSDTGCEHQGPGEDPKVSHSLGCLGCPTSELRVRPGQAVPDAQLSLGPQGTSF